MSPAPHVFVTMDGVRGVAAIAVMLGHFSFRLGGGWVLFPSNYFAVDIFFCLSGFVISYAYEDRLKSGMSPISFMKLRLIRLYPLYALGLGLGAFHVLGELYLGNFHNEIATLLLVITFGLLFLPWGGKFDNGRDGGQNDAAIYPLNMPSWSLLFELMVSASYALFRPAGKTLVVVLGLSLLLIACDAPPYFMAIQIPRVVFGFYLGAALCGLWRQGRLRLPRQVAILAPVAAVALCCLPFNGPGYMAALALGAPFVLVLATATPHSRVLRELFAQLGAMSYPLYTLHMPAFSIMRLTINSLTGSNLDAEPSAMAKSLLALGLLFVCAWLARTVDLPLRRKMAALLFPAAPASRRILEASAAK